MRYARAGDLVENNGVRCVLKHTRHFSMKHGRWTAEGRYERGIFVPPQTVCGTEMPEKTPAIEGFSNCMLCLTGADGDVSYRQIRTRGRQIGKSNTLRGHTVIAVHYDEPLSMGASIGSRREESRKAPTIRQQQEAFKAVAARDRVRARHKAQR